MTKEKVAMPPAAVENTYCCSLRFVMGMVAVVLFLDFIRQVIYLTEIFINPYFNICYGIVYLIILLVFATAVVLIAIFLFARDTKENRKLAPWSFLLAAVSSFLLALWVFLFIETIHR